MAILKSDTRQQQLISDLSVATTEWARGKGLLGKSNMGPEEALLIPRCNSIHTFFMKMTIDCVFIDKEMIIKAIHHQVKPYKLIWPVWGARSVIEFGAGRAQELQLQIGEKLHVGH
ncbi:MAG: DUF192 domain-containing protein [Bdellovibrionaceae bacterium]|nr:DUF192 domain-containing protein [Pseudobdellovibrionaceae bacterium]